MRCLFNVRPARLRFVAAIRLFSVPLLLCFATVSAEWRQGPADLARAPATTRSSSGDTTWVRVHDPGQSPCPATSAEDVESVWCFEGANGDSTWPANPAGGTWRHWSRFNPPVPTGSKWHVTALHGGASGGTYNAWAGCDVSESHAPCDETAFWVNAGGYGDDWNYALALECTGQDATTGGTIEFDLRYDAGASTTMSVWSISTT